MSLRHTTLGGLVCTTFLLAASTLFAQSAAAEKFTATASVKGAGGAEATAPVTLTVDHKMSQAEADKLLAAFKSGGAAGLRKALTGIAPTGSVTVGGGKPTPTRVTVERTTDKGRLLTMVTDRPILFLGAGVPGAKPKAGYDFAVIDLEIDAKGAGSGTMAPAAKVTVKDGAFVVEDYGGETVRLTKVTPSK
jgi:hypothetical protein